MSIQVGSALMAVAGSVVTLWLALNDKVPFGWSLLAAFSGGIICRVVFEAIRDSRK